LRPGIERQTFLMPWLIAESIRDEAGQWLGIELPEEWAGLLDAKAERCFAGHPQFRRLVSAGGNQGNAGRANLRRFMRHWLAGLLYRIRRDIFRRLPWSYGLGAPPARKSPSLKR
jgi:hypothetical protein